MSHPRKLNPADLHSSVAENAANRLSAIRCHLDSMCEIAKPYFKNNEDEGKFAVEVVDLLMHLRQVEMDVEELEGYVPEKTETEGAVR